MHLRFSFAALARLVSALVSNGAILENIHAEEGLGFLRALGKPLRLENGLIGRAGRIKVLARGEIAKALTIRAHKFSGKAAEKIAAAGGKAEVLA